MEEIFWTLLDLILEFITSLVDSQKILLKLHRDRVEFFNGPSTHPTIHLFSGQYNSQCPFIYLSDVLFLPLLIVVFETQQKKPSFLTLGQLASEMHDKVLIVACPDSFRYGLLHLIKISAQLQKSFLTVHLRIVHCEAKVDGIVRIFLDIIHVGQYMNTGPVQQVGELPTTKQHFHGYVIIVELVSGGGLKRLHGKSVDEGWQLRLIGPQKKSHDFDEEYLLVKQIFVNRQFLDEPDVVLKHRDTIFFFDGCRYIFHISQLQKETIDLQFCVQIDIFLTRHAFVNPIYVFHELYCFRKMPLSENSIYPKCIQDQQCIIHTFFRIKASNFLISILVNYLDHRLQNGLNLIRMMRSEQIELNLDCIRHDIQDLLSSCLFKKCKAIFNPIWNLQRIINFPEMCRQSSDSLVLNDQAEDLFNLNSERALKAYLAKVETQGKLQEIAVIRSMAQIKQDNLSHQVHAVFLGYFSPLEEVIKKLYDLKGRAFSHPQPMYYKLQMEILYNFFFLLEIIEHFVGQSFLSLFLAEQAFTNQIAEIPHLNLLLKLLFLQILRIASISHLLQSCLQSAYILMSISCNALQIHQFDELSLPLLQKCVLLLLK